MRALALLVLAACAGPPDHVSEWTVAAGTYTGLNWTTSAPDRVPDVGFQPPVGAATIVVSVDDADKMHVSGTEWIGYPQACTTTIPCVEFSLAGPDLYGGMFQHFTDAFGNETASLSLTFYSHGAWAHTYGMKQ